MPATTLRRDVMTAEDAAHLRRTIGRLHRQLRVSAGMGITPSQMSCLSSVVRHGPLRVGDLAVREGINPTTLSRIVGRLEELGLVERTPDPADRRSAVLTATDTARETLHQIEHDRSAVLFAAVEQLPPDVQSTLKQALPALDALLAIANPESAREVSR